MAAKHYISHFVRFSPYLNNNIYSFQNISDSSNVFLKRNTYGIDFTYSNYIDYLKNTSKNHKRSLKKYQDICRFSLREISKK